MSNEHDHSDDAVERAVDRTEEALANALQESIDLADDTTEGAEGARDSITHEVEDMIPGDSDGDGH